MIDLSGAYLPVTTPFDPVTGDVDIVAFRANLRHWFQHDLAGILIAGSTGESVFLDDAEARSLQEAANDVLPAAAKVIMGAAAESTRHTIKKVKAAADAGADAVLVKPPVYFKGAMTPEALVAHYRAVADASPVPVLIYQVPLRLSTLEFPTGLVAELSRHDNIVGIKDSRGSLDKLGELVEAVSTGFQVLVGSGALFYPALEVGAAGGITALGLMAPAEMAAIDRAWKDGRTADAGRIQERIAPVHNGIVGGIGVPGIKVALDMLGLHGGPTRSPLLPLPVARHDEVRSLLDGAGLLAAART
ncbi:MAG: dihydrodipicolinate synthase family protein [Longimicrobiales bacterium]